MCSPRTPLVFLILICSLAGVAGATYGGDRPLNATYFGDVNGGYLFTMGTSGYMGSVLQGETYNVSYSFDLPVDANVTFQRMYLYWAWSRIGQKAVFPGFVLFDSRDPGTPLTLAARYPDSKGFVSQYDFYSGLDAYDLPPLAPGHNEFNITCEQAGLPNSSAIIFGIGVLAVYDQGGFKSYTGTIDRYPGSGETVDLYAAVETMPPAAPTSTPLSPLIAVFAVAAAVLTWARRKRQL